MPLKKHLCAHIDCTEMISGAALNCRRHKVFSETHRANLSKAGKLRVMPPETGAKISASKSGTGLRVRLCEFCGNTFTVAKPSAKARFCSSACGYANRKGARAFNWRSDMPTKTCRVCGKQFRVLASTTVDQRFTCSYTCKNIWQKTHQPNKATNIERITEQAIRNRGWSYETQVGLCNVTVADFYLLEVGIVIFCDGDYWHSLPEHIARDGRQTDILRANGYQVYRFLGSAIMRDVEACLDTINYPAVLEAQRVVQLALPTAEALSQPTLA